MATRRLDINDVQLIIQCEPIHHFGRTGRAGNTGVAILLYEPRYSRSVFKIEKESGVKFEHISAPQASDIAESAGSEVAQAISNVSESVVPMFRPQAEVLLRSSGLSAMDLALAFFGFVSNGSRSCVLLVCQQWISLLKHLQKQQWGYTC